MDDTLAAIRTGFFLECDEHLGALDDALADAAFAGGPVAEAATPGAAAIHAAFRAVHSIKGGAASLGYEGLADVAHGFETALAALRDGRAAAMDLPHALWQGAADRLAAAVAAARNGQTAAAGPDALTLALNAAERPPEGAGPVEAGPAALADAGAPAPWQVRFAPDARFETLGGDPAPPLRALAALGATDLLCDLTRLPALADIAATTATLAWTLTLPAEVTAEEILAPFAFLDAEAAVEIARATPEESAAPPPPVAAPAPPPPAAANPTGQPTIRVDLARVDRLLNLAGELLIGQSLLATRLAEAGLGRTSAARDALDQLAATSRALQEAVVALRSEPVKPLFQRMGRILREAARATGKEVAFEIAGEATELDRSVLDRLVEPLTHMIRNAVDHGIEPPDVRRAAGKPPEGRITLAAAHRAGRVVIEVADDGRGLDRARILARGAALGLLPPPSAASRSGSLPSDLSPGARPAGPDAPAAPTGARASPATAALSPQAEATADQLLFQPGLSTATSVTALSGRGVGMDVVRSALAAAGGRVAVQSQPGRGTRFTLSLPLTLSVVDVLMVRIAGQTFALPQSAVLETRLVSMLPSAPFLGAATEAQLVALRGRHVPLRSAADLLSLAPPDLAASPPDPVAVLLTDEDDRWLALSVDAVLDQTQVVMKGFGAALRPAPGISAATILSDGQVALILDPPGLISLAAAAQDRCAA